MAGEDDPLEALLGTISFREDELAAERAGRRSQRRRLRQLATESSTLSGVLFTLAERGDPVTVHCGPFVHQGRLSWVTQSVAALDQQGSLVLLAVPDIAVVESPEPITDDRTGPEHPNLAEALAELAPGHPPVRLQLHNGAQQAGTLLDVGADIVRLRLASSVATVALSAVACCLVRARSATWA